MTTASTTAPMPSSHSPHGGWLSRYTWWLHLKWPAGRVEKLPEVQGDGSTNVPGLYIVGDLAGIPLLKFSADSGAKCVQGIVKGSAEFKRRSASIPRVPSANGLLDLVIIGGGVAGHSAAIEARRAGLNFILLEASEAFSTIVNFPRGKPIYTYPTDMIPTGAMRFESKVKEPLVEELRAQAATNEIKTTPGRAELVRRTGGHLEVILAKDSGAAEGSKVYPAKYVIVAIGRSGNYRRLNVPGEDLDKVYNRLHDPHDYVGKKVLVVGGGDSALETAIAVADAGAIATISYRGQEFSRAKPDNVDRLQQRTATQPSPGRIEALLGSVVRKIQSAQVTVRLADGSEKVLANDAVFAMIGREAPLDFLRRSGVRIHRDWRPWTVISLLAFVFICVLLYHWKGQAPNDELGLHTFYVNHGLVVDRVPNLLDSLGSQIRQASNRPTHFLYTLRKGMGNPAFYYTLMYCSIVTIFGIRRIRRRRTAYVKWQTICLILFQCIPLFILPELLLPWLGRNGLFETGRPLHWLADHLWESYDVIGHERAYWRSYGFILAFPLNVYNVFTDHPLWLWLVICFVQTFILIPGLVYFWGKGAYCGWICSCGALAETLGDQHRQKMPHGPIWNRVNFIGQFFLLMAFIILGLRIVSWMIPGGVLEHAYSRSFERLPFLNYHWFVDVLFGGILGVGFYFWFSGRVWCRFACPLAALMHIYARFSRFRILADKKKCISCNVCTSVCHQGIDIMSFANKGVPMADPQCVRCSACVQMCPTGVLSFGQVDRATEKTIKLDPPWLAASPVLVREVLINGQKAST